MSDNTGEGISHAQLARDWALGKTLPPDVQTIKDWLQLNFGELGPREPGARDAVAVKAAEEGWHIDSVNTALFIYTLAGINDLSNKPAA